MIVYLMGVSGSGKSTIGVLLAERMGIRFVDGDDFHPAANKDKMAHGIPLEDSDRKPWLQALNELACKTAAAGQGMVIACSALKAVYREWLTFGLPPDNVFFVLLEGSRDLIAGRLSRRRHPFMNSSLLDSQLATLEEPENAIRVVNDEPAEQVAGKILERLTAGTSKQ